MLWDGRTSPRRALPGEHCTTAGEGGTMETASEFAQLQLRFVDQVQWRYELIRPLVLLEERPAPPEAIRQRAHATGSHPETVRKFTRRFEQQGLLGLLPEAVAIVPKGPTSRVPPEVLEEIGRLKALYEGFQYHSILKFFHIPTDLVVAQEASDVESGSRLDFLLLHNLRRHFIA